MLDKLMQMLGLGGGGGGDVADTGASDVNNAQPAGGTTPEPTPVVENEMPSMPEKTPTMPVENTDNNAEGGGMENANDATSDSCPDCGDGECSCQK